MTTDLVEINEEELERENHVVLRHANDIKITSQKSYVTVTELGKAINARINAIRNYFKPMKQAADATKQRILDKEKAAIGPLDALLERVSREMVAWDQEQERKRREAERKLNEEAQRKAAELAASNGDAEEAREIISATPPVIVPKATPKVDGVSYTDRWSAEVMDLKSLCLAVGQGKQPLTLIQANLPALNGMARSLKTAMQIPGVRAVVTRDVTRRL